jgi:ankyrin repeat protein
MKKIVLFFYVLFCANSIHSQQRTVFEIARNGTIEEVKNLFNQNQEVINSVDENKSSPLLLACYRGNIEVAKFLIKNVKNIDYTSDMGSALMAATYKNQVELVKFLLENKANPNITDINGVSPLMLAVQFNNFEATNLLLNYKADKLLKDNKGKTAFEYAIASKNEQLINLLNK